MKKSFVFITIIALLFSLIGCSTDNAPLTGSIKVSVNDSASRTITSAVSPKAVKYMVEGTAPDGSPVSFELSKSTPSWTNAEAAPGNWSFTATAYNADGKAIGDGSSSATVVPGQSTSATIEVHEYSGMGRITVNLTGTNFDQVRYTATIFKMTEGNMAEIASGEFDTGIVSFTLQNGFYALVLSCNNTAIIMPPAEAVRIMKDDNLSVSYSICDQGDVEAIISNGIKPCPEMSVTLSSESIYAGNKVTATASITQGIYNYIWYVNDVMLESVNGNSVDITLDEAGDYKITCIAYNTVTGVVWSQVATVNAITPLMNTVSFYSGNKLIETRECPAGSTQTFPTIELGEGFKFSGWKAEGSDDDDEPIKDKSFSLPYSEEEYKFYAYITTDLLTIDETGAVYGTNVLKNSSTIKEVAIPYSIRGKAVTSIGNYAFENFSNLISITIPDSVTSIGLNAFSGCSNLTSITIPNSVTTIDEWAFYKCSSLTSITIPDSVTFIDSSAFTKCFLLNSIKVSDYNKYYKSLDGILFDKNVQTIIVYPCGKRSKYYAIPDSVTSIGQRAFANCSNIEITIPDSVTSIESSAFEGCRSLTSITIPDSVTSIGGCAFYGCSRLTSITIPGSVTSIGKMAFKDCASLTSITIPDSVTSIGEWAFYDCSNLTSITIPNSVTSIGSAAFFGCSRLTNITIPDSVTSIGEQAFYNCSKLTNITIPDSVTSIESSAFNRCSSLTSITIPDSVTSIGSAAFFGCSRLTSITIPGSVTSIGEQAFFDCSSLTSITIPNSVTSIGQRAFNNCTSLTSITIPNSVTSIGQGAFNNCSRLTSITIPNSVTSIEVGAFYNCSKLTNITIPDSVTLIGYDAFYGCSSLTIITIPNSVTYIGSDAFLNCTELKEIRIDKPRGSGTITGAKWGAPSSTEVKWQGEF